MKPTNWPCPIATSLHPVQLLERFSVRTSLIQRLLDRVYAAPNPTEASTNLLALLDWYGRTEVERLLPHRDRLTRCPEWYI